MCGSCCRGLQEGEVYVYLEDIVKLVDYLKNEGRSYSLKSFAKEYLKITNQSFTWKDPKTKIRKTYKVDTLGFKFIGNDEHCEFLDSNNRCTVHEARPFQCRAFPIGWNMLVKDYDSFRDYSKKCVALRSSLKKKGNFYPKEKIANWARMEKKIELDYFLKMKSHDFDIFKVYPFLPKDITRE